MYVPSENNPADMITRGLSIDKFKQQLEVWVSGPEWLRSTPVDWPKSELNCLSDNSKNIVQATVMYNTISSLDLNAIVPENKYSSLDKLIAVTTRVFQFIYKLRKKDEDYSLKTKQYLFKIMQEKCFPNELVFLKDPQNKNVPALVNNLNLFLDDDGIIRTKGRISKTLVFDYEITNPILLAKNHHLTELIIIDAHKRCKHLGIQTTLNKVRLSGYLIPKARQIVKRVI